jgi:hypothetical protein
MTMDEVGRKYIGYQDPKKPVGPVDPTEIIALQRGIAVETNARGASFTPRDLINTVGNVMEAVGAIPPGKPNPNYRGKPDRPDPGRRPRGKRTFFDMGRR